MSPSSKGKRSVKESKSKSPKGSKLAESPVKKSPTPKPAKSRSKATTPVQGANTTIGTPLPTARTEDEPSKPGSADWVYVDEKLNEKLAKIMCDHWDVTENSYLTNSKYVFRKIRAEREQIIRYFFTAKTNFKEYLRRPDTKQVYIDSFVKVE